MLRAIVIEPTKAPRIEEISGDSDIKKLLNNGWIEAVYLGGVLAVFMDEDGKMKNLTPNAVATRLCQRFRAIRQNDFVAGTVVVTGMLNDQGKCDGELYDVPQSAIDTIVNFKHFGG